MAWEFPDGTALELLPEGGRVLGLFARGDERSFFWIHPHLAEPARGTALLRRADNFHPGGDRIWLAPERDLHFPDERRTDYEVPRGVDPGAYTLRPVDGEVELSNSGEVAHLSARRRVGFRLTRRISPTGNPLRHLPPPAGVRFAGYAQRTRLELHAAPGSAEAGMLGLWSLLQLPAPGRMLVATHCRAEPVTMVGELPPSRLSRAGSGLAWDMVISDTTKLGIPAWAASGRIGYRRRHGEGDDDLIVRNFLVDPSGDYVDSLTHQPQVRGFAAQYCHAVIEDAHFNELEYHAPAIPVRAEGGVSEDVSQLWAWRGPAEALDRIAALVLGPVATLRTDPLP